jgi:prepilin-type N-terminal cleavage/methylation domain-containing protein
MIKNINRKAFTLAELLVATMIMAIVMSAIVSMSYAMGSANDFTDDTASKQAQLRCALMEIKDLIRKSKLVLGTPVNCLVLWREDKNADSQVNADEVIYLKFDSTKSVLQKIEYEKNPVNPDWQIPISEIQSGMAGNNLNLNCNPTTMNVIPGCISAFFKVDSPTKPALSKKASVQFVILENGSSRTYVISGTLVAPAYNR